MKHRICSAAVLLALVFCPSLYADLDGSVRAIMADKISARSQVGIAIARLGADADHSTVLFASNSHTPLVPASNLKLITASAALAGLGADFHFQTMLALHDQDLVLIGDGDPAFGDADLLHKSGWDVTTVFKTWADVLKKRNLTAVRNVLVDDTVFDQNFFHPHWPVDQAQRHYAPQIAGMSLNLNCIDFYLQTTSPGQLVRYTTNPPTHYVTVKNDCLSGGENAIWLSRNIGSNDLVLKGRCLTNNDVPVTVTIHDPPLYSATVLSETLAAAGITMSGHVDRDHTARAAIAGLHGQADPHWTLLAIHQTPLAQALARANKDSVNLYAESLCKRLGFAATGQSGSWENGTAAVGAFLRSAGVSPGEFHLDDGCGLSKENAISANAVARVLIYDFFSANRQALFTSMAVGGADGTLEHRFEGDLRGRVWAKSGFVNGVSCLSGYLKARDDNWYVFSILINNIPGGGKPIEEAIVAAIDKSVPRAGP